MEVNYFHLNDKVVCSMPKQQSKCILKNPLLADTLAIQVKKVDLICDNGLWLFQLLRRDPCLVPLFWQDLSAVWA